MSKDFDGWNSVKQKVNGFNNKYIKSGEIWICNLGINVGYEIDGKGSRYFRPVLVLSGFGKEGGIVFPMTTVSKSNKFLFEISENNFINLTQIRFMDSKRFSRIIGKVDFRTIQLIKKQFLKII